MWCSTVAVQPSAVVTRSHSRVGECADAGGRCGDQCGPSSRSSRPGPTAHERRPRHRLSLARRQTQTIDGTFGVAAVDVDSHRRVEIDTDGRHPRRDELQIRQDPGYSRAGRTDPAQIEQHLDRIARVRPVLVEGLRQPWSQRVCTSAVGLFYSCSLSLWWCSFCAVEGGRSCVVGALSYVLIST